MAKGRELTLLGNSRALLLLALIAGAVAAVLVFVAVNDSGDDGGGTLSADSAEVVVAAQEISAGTEITTEMVELRAVPEDLILVGSFTQAEPFIGDRARITIAKGEQVTNTKIGLAVPDAGLAGVVPPGMRAVAIEVRELTAVGGLLLPGDRVDLVATTRIDSAPGSPKTITSCGRRRSCRTWRYFRWPRKRRNRLQAPARRRTARLTTPRTQAVSFQTTRTSNQARTLSRWF